MALLLHKYHRTALKRQETGTETHAHAPAHTPASRARTTTFPPSGEGCRRVCDVTAPFQLASLHDRSLRQHRFVASPRLIVSLESGKQNPV